MNKEYLLDDLKTFLIEKQYSPGDKIATEMELAKHFNVSRNKIREVSIALCQLGILEKRARRGTILKTLDPQSIGEDLRFQFSMAKINSADFHEARMIIEAAILPLTVKRITPILLARLENKVGIMEQDNVDPAMADAADRDFHLIILEACGNKTLQAFGGVIQALFRKERRIAYWGKDAIKRAGSYHRKIYDAIKSEDAELAIKYMRGHLANLL